MKRRRANKWADTLREMNYMLRKEQYDGLTTRHECKCGRMSTRMGKCVLCLKEAIAKVAA